MRRLEDLEVAPRAGRPAFVEEIAGGLEFARLRGEWDALLVDSGAEAFLSWEWLYPWWRRIAPEATPRLLAARDPDGRLEGLLPLAETRLPLAGVTVRRWGFLGDSHVGSDYLEVLARRGDEERMTGLLVEHLAARRHRFDVLELLDLPQGSLLADRVIERLGPQALRVERFVRYECPQILPSGDFASYLRSAGRADNLARRRKWLAAQPGFAIDRVETGPAVGEALADFFRLHALRWARDGGSQGIGGAEVRAFHRDATAWLAERGGLRLYTLRVGGRALASVYAVLHRDRVYYYQSGYDPEWARRSVGLVLLAETIGDAFRERRAVFDFLRGSEPYKSEWANARRQTEGVRIVSRSAAGAAWLLATEGRGAVKQAARGLVGQGIWTRASRLKRGLAGRARRASTTPGGR